ncbi:MAG: hypothetical protein R3C97_02925 [Geminicoccaceae bacterium]
MRPLTLAMAFGIAMLLSAPLQAGSDTSEFSYERFADEQSVDHPLYCMYGYFASKTGDHETARKIFDRCVNEAHNPAAMIYLSLFYEEGLGTDPDPGKAQELVEMAARQGYSVGQYLHGKALLENATDEATRKEAFGWLERAAAQGDKDAAELLRSVRAY